MKKKVGFSTLRTSPIRFWKVEAWDQALNAHCLQNTYYFFPSKYTTSNNEEQQSIYFHYNGDQIHQRTFLCVMCCFACNFAFEFSIRVIFYLLLLKFSDFICFCWIHELVFLYKKLIYCTVKYTKAWITECF